jgi:hypothetical protein
MCPKNLGNPLPVRLYVCRGQLDVANSADHSLQCYSSGPLNRILRTQEAIQTRTLEISRLTRLHL